MLMSGICGVWDSEGNIDKELITSMISAMPHRGHDDSGVFIDKNVGLGSSRLSTIDVKTGRQPIYNEDGSLWIVFSGEFYNFADERAKLTEKRHKFYTNSDSEVALHLYEEYGTDCIQHMNGQFAFAIYDSNIKRLFLARDRLGIKPLVYFFDGRRFEFASEIKSLLKDHYVSKEIDQSAVNDFFSFGFIPAPKTIFKNIKKLPSAHTLTLQQNKLYLREYWDVDFGQKQKANLEHEFAEKLTESVKQRLIGDTPIGVVVSGDIESAAIVSAISRLTKNIKTYSIGFENEDPKEMGYSRKISEMLGSEHREFVVKPATFDMFAKLVYYLDEPFADPSVITAAIVSNMAARHTKAMITGYGSDALFAGDEIYTKGRVRGFYSKLPGIIRDPVTFAFSGNEHINRYLSLGNIQDDERRFFEINSLFTSEEKHLLLNNPMQSKISLFSKSNAENIVDKKLYTELKFMLANQELKKIDASSMFSGVEARVPFLDHNFVEFAASIPANKKLKLFENKHILRKIASKYVTDEIAYRKKQKMTPPVGEWMKSELKDVMHELILGEKLKSRDYFEHSYLEKLWEQHQSGKFDHSRRLFSIAAFELWHRIFVDNENPCAKGLNELI
jgi:asparagine synthase (glutamine-hydrolysing)